MPGCPAWAAAAGHLPKRTRPQSCFILNGAWEVHPHLGLQPHMRVDPGGRLGGVRRSVKHCGGRGTSCPAGMGPGPLSLSQLRGQPGRSLLPLGTWSPGVRAAGAGPGPGLSSTMGWPTPSAVTGEPRPLLATSPAPSGDPPHRPAQQLRSPGDTVPGHRSSSHSLSRTESRVSLARAGDGARSAGRFLGSQEYVGGRGCTPTAVSPPLDGSGVSTSCSGLRRGSPQLGWEDVPLRNTGLI